MADSSSFPGGTEYVDLSGRAQAKIFAIDDTVTPPQPGWVTIEYLVSTITAAAVAAATGSTTSSVMEFSDGTIADFSDGTPLTFSS